MARRMLAGLIGVLLAGSASAEISPAIPAPPRVAATALAGESASSCCRLAAATPVVIELAEDVNSKRYRRGDTFAIQLGQTIVVDGHALIPAGVTGRGEVVDAAPGGLAGRPGKLILAARFLDYNGVRLPLRGFKLASGGRDNGALVLALSDIPDVGILSLAISGGNIDYPAGTWAIAKIASDTDLSAASAASAPSTTHEAAPASVTRP
jgi:hypothetical protein